MARRNLIKGWLTLAGVSMVMLAGAASAQSELRRPLLWLLGWAGLESVITFSLLGWALSCPVNVFYGIFVGGSLVRLASLMIVAIMLNVVHIAPAVPLLTLTGSYFILSLLQIPFLGQDAWIS